MVSSNDVTEQDDFCPMHGERVAHVKVAGGEPGCTCPSASPASSNDVTITEGIGDELILTGGRFSPRSRLVIPEDAAALRAYFAAEIDDPNHAYVIGYRKALDDVAERMPEDVQKLVGEADRLLSYSRTDKGVRVLIGRLAAALEAAYSQNGADDDPR